MSAPALRGDQFGMTRSLTTDERERMQAATFAPRPRALTDRELALVTAALKAAAENPVRPGEKLEPPGMDAEYRYLHSLVASAATIHVTAMRPGPEERA